MSVIVIRPTFNYKNEIAKPIRAGGVIIYKKINNDIFLLLIKKNIDFFERFEDIGGKTDVVDTDEFDTISREVQEETNFIINQKIIKNQIINSNKSIYSFKSKYLLFFVKANKYEKKLITEQFGNAENHDSIERTIHWINIKLIINNNINLHPRLKLMGDELKNMFGLI